MKSVKVVAGRWDTDAIRRLERISCDFVAPTALFPVEKYDGYWHGRKIAVAWILPDREF